MKFTNLFYGIVGAIAYCKQAKAKGVKLKATPENFVKKVFVDDAELSIHYIPDINKMGIAFGGVIYNAITHKAFIVVDDYFHNLNEDMQEFIIGHELGHYTLGHYAEMGLKHIWSQCVFLGKLQCANDKEKNLLLESTLYNRDYSKELEADKFAVNYSSEHAALSFLLMAHTIAPYNPEIISRYKAVTGVMPDTEPVKEMIDFGIFKDTKVVSVDTLE